MVRYIDRTRYRKSYRDVVDFYRRFVKNYPYAPSHPLFGLNFGEQEPSTAPAITSIDLDLGDTSGGELRTLTGTGFTGATSVTVGGTAATAFYDISDTELIVVMPAHVAATSQSILVTTPGGTNAANTLYEFWSPAELALTGFWDKGNYQDTTAGTWPGRTSAGASGGRDLTQASATNQPAEVGLAPDFDGVNDYQSGPVLSTLFGAGSGFVVLLFLSRTAPADGGTTAPYTRPVLCDPGGTGLQVGFTDAGIRAGCYDGSTWDSVVQPAATNALHLAAFRWDGTTQGLSVDGAAFSTSLQGVPAHTGGLLRLGADYTLLAYATVAVAMVATADVALSDANATKFLKWARACRGLAA